MIGLADKGKIDEESTISGIPFLSFFVHSTDSVLFSQPKVNHHMINPKTAKDVNDTAMADPIIASKIPFEAEYNILPYEICTDNQGDSPVWELWNVYPNEDGEHELIPGRYARPLYKKVFIHTVEKSKRMRKCWIKNVILSRNMISGKMMIIPVSLAPASLPNCFLR